MPGTTSRIIGCETKGGPHGQAHRAEGRADPAARWPGASRVGYDPHMKRHPFSDRLRCITREIVATYGASQKIASHIDPDRRLPSRPAVVHILENLFAVLYPGFYGVQHLTHDNVEYHVGALLDDIA